MRFDFRCSRVIQGIVLFGLPIFSPACPAQQEPFRSVFVLECVTKHPACDDDRKALGNSTGAPVSLSGTVGSSALGEVLTASLFAQSTFGFLRANSSGSFNILVSPGLAQATAVADFGDIITMDFPPLRGQQGQLIIRYVLHGNISAQGPTLGAALVSLTVANPDGSNPQEGGANYFSSVSGLFTEPQIFHFIYGQPFALDFGLQVVAATGTANRFARIVGQGKGNVDFSNTLALVAMEVSDANGNALSGPATFTSASGTQYSEDGVLTSFSEFTAHAEPSQHLGAFKAEGVFRLGTNSDGIAPLTEDVTLQVGSFSATVSGGSFTLHEENTSKFEGIINGQRLEMSIRPLTDGRFKFSASGIGADLTTQPVTVRLIIGDDGGKTTATGAE